MPAISTKKRGRKSTSSKKCRAVKCSLVSKQANDHYDEIFKLRIGVMFIGRIGVTDTKDEQLQNLPKQGAKRS